MQEEKLKRTATGKVITCATIIIDPAGSILGCHPTGKAPNQMYDLPKGCADEGEDDLSAALRELKEETSLILEKGDLQDLGIHEYLRTKDIHIFLHRVSSLPDTSSLECTSTFEAFGKHIKEIDGFRHIPIAERSRFSRSIQAVLQKVIVN